MSDTTTRSGMLWEVERILTECKEKPQILLMENVPQVHGEGNKEDFNKWQFRLEELGYKNYWQDLIATDYGIPQTRNRCFMISILGDYNYTFPKSTPLKLKLKDMLEDKVNEKYYLSDKTLLQISNWKSYQNPLDSVMGNESISPTITTRIAESQDGGINASMKVYCNNLGNTSNLKKYYLSNKMIDYITSKDDKYKVNENKLVINREVACSKTTREGNTRADTSDYICKELPENTNILKIKNATKKGYLEAKEGDCIDLCQPGSQTRRGRVQKQKAQTITTMGGEHLGIVSKCLKIRKLTPKECFRLMGVKDEDYEKIAKNQSDSSLYHLAGDSIVVNVLMAIFKELI